VTFSLIELMPSADGLRLDTKVSIDRVAAGVGWNKMGMIEGKAYLGASIVLARS
jgi:hypothetical protein